MKNRKIVPILLFKLFLNTSPDSRTPRALPPGARRQQARLEDGATTPTHWRCTGDARMGRT
eukprot:6523242-Pyramimonas_sp.AAC.1